ncbi:MAG: hypothetical protein ACP5FL_03860 [Thermoplasmatota archaeon]
MNTSAAVTLVSVVLIIVFLTPDVLASVCYGTSENHLTQDNAHLQQLVETELLFVPNIPLLESPTIDFMVGNGMVHGLFLASNRLVTTTITMVFFKWVPPDWISLDLVCTHINVKAIDWNGNLVDQQNLTDPSGFLFSNNWQGTATLARPPLSSGLFFFVFIEIYGNYE